MKDTKILEIMKSPAPKLLSPFTELELTEALAYTANALCEVIDAVFLSHSDHGFLTRERAEDLRVLQNAAQILGEIAAVQLAGMVGGGEL